MTLTLSRTRPFRNLQSSIGSATYRLNTILVGLQQVANGADKTDALHVSWRKPSLEKAGQVSDQARIFVCSAAMTFANDSFDSFIRAIVREEWLSFSTKTRDIVSKSITKNGGVAYSLADRAEAIFKELGMNEVVDVASIELFSKWRNMIIHERSDDVRHLPSFSEDILKNAAAYFYTNYSHLNIDLALTNYMAGKAPVPKEATSLIAIIQNVARKIDEASIKRVASDPTDFERIIFALLGEHFTKSKGRHPTALAALKEAWQGGISRREKSLEQILANLGVSKDHKKPISIGVPDEFISKTAQLDPQAFAKKIEII